MAPKEISDLTPEDYAKAKLAISEALTAKKERDGTIFLAPTSIDTANALIEADAAIMLFSTLTPGEERLIKDGYRDFSLEAEDIETAIEIFRSLPKADGLPNTDRIFIRTALDERRVALEASTSKSAVEVPREVIEQPAQVISEWHNPSSPGIEALREVIGPLQEPVSRWRKVRSAGGVIIDLTKDLSKTAGGLFAAFTTSTFEGGAGYSLFAQDRLEAGIGLGVAGVVSGLVCAAIGIAEIADKENQTFVHEVFRNRYRARLGRNRTT